VADLATSVVPYAALSVLMYLALDFSYLLALALAIPAAGFLVRTFIVFHDCAHGSFLPSKRANAWLGSGLGPLVFESFANWRHSHAVHHATAGDLDRRGVGDVHTLTVAEYRASTWRSRLGYRLFRNPLVMFGLGPIYGMVLHPRLVPRSARPRIRRSVIGTNLALAALVGTLCLLVGWREYLLVQGPITLLAGAAGGSSTSSTSSRTRTGRVQPTGPTPTRPCAAAVICDCRGCSSSSRGTSDSTTCTT
jgi:omega-6 fatty acid desaturase (delta-12 desaturase)